MAVAWRYEERQASTIFAVIISAITLVAVVAAVAGTCEWSVLYGVLPVLLIGDIVLFAFTVLTVTIAGSELEWHFRWGVWRKRIALADITAVEAVRNPWWYGWGIRSTPPGWLHSARGRRAVAVTTAAGRTVLIGSDRPERLAEAIRQRVPSSGHDRRATERSLALSFACLRTIPSVGSTHRHPGAL